MAILSVKILRKTVPMLASRKGFPNQDMHNSTVLVKAVFPRNSVCSTLIVVRKAKSQKDIYSYRLIYWLFREQYNLEHVR